MKRIVLLLILINVLLGMFLVCDYLICSMQKKTIEIYSVTEAHILLKSNIPQISQNAGAQNVLLKSLSENSLNRDRAILNLLQTTDSCVKITAVGAFIVNFFMMADFYRSNLKKRIELDTPTKAPVLPKKK